MNLIRKALADGEIGRPTLIEADYLHAMSPADVTGLIGDPAHWRGRIEPTASCTHTLSPILSLTGELPVEVSAYPVEPKAEGTVHILEGFRACVEHGAQPLVPVEQAIAASLVGVAGARSLREGSRPIEMPKLSE
ncbi:hypothetical protein [Nocardia ignorata]|uniref:hypothetical protein n=1 Tax=Nocardia ignorata TaxID=145285 RepID=UPI001AACDE99|nr:hypothetical protein [Nocardia ignorata]